MIIADLNHIEDVHEPLKIVGGVSWGSLQVNIINQRQSAVSSAVSVAYFGDAHSEAIAYNLSWNGQLIL